MAKKLTIQDTLKTIIQDHVSCVQFAYLFGSKALGTDMDKSDIDITVYIIETLLNHRS